MSRNPTEVEKKIAEGKVHELYKDPEKYISAAVAVYERNALCEICGQKRMKVQDWLKREVICQGCGSKG